MANETKERAEQGKEILKKQRAQGKPGSKQPAHEDARKSAEETIEELDKIQEKLQVETKQSSAKKSQESGNLNETPPEERSRGFEGDQNLALANAAASRVSAARSALTAQLEADARLTSDPRYERDQKVFEMGRTGHLQFVPAPEEETLVAGARSGLSPEVAKEVEKVTPHTPQEQADRDMERLEKGEKIAAQVAAGEERDEEKKPSRSSSSGGTDDTPPEKRTNEQGQIRPGVQEGYQSPPKPPAPTPPPQPERKGIK